MRDPFSQARMAMVENQIISRGITDARVLAAMRTVPRHAFIPDQFLEEAYEDHPLPVGEGQTISQPFIVALMTSHLELAGSEKVLEIGTGSGYQAAILARLAKEVHSVERIPELASKAEATIKELGIRNVAVHVGDGSLGWPENEPYDRIIVTAAAPAVPVNLTDQLKPGGKIIIPVGARWHQMLEVWEKTALGMDKKEILPVVFVPLLGQKGWQEKDW
ncbi:MAG: protein-L-isoaspartate(D-aspartate) O-methyltransferase [Anaerolineaceae bacterium]|nr:protein-L-isoaspartate(D-aspartate) O-methyltransferase [Anaerolineaceae bacterium]